ncbi:MAG: MBL fold metallo-hydrolase [Tepidisphaeraceae bacterium]|jgi:phosphoribosyl 1,2-cyclic phosphate phosphodiesterase
MDRVELLFLGTGTSAGVPMIGCDCAVCASTDPRDKRTRPSVVISYDGTRVLIDTTPELRLQCVEHRVKRIDAVVFTHAHADHIMGLDDVRRFNTVKGGALDVWAEPRTHEVLQRCFAYAFREPDPACRLYRPHLVPREIDGPFEINGVKWRPIRLIHGNVPVLGFRVGNVAYCTDTNLIPEESFELLRGLDVLVLDGLRFERHSTHFSVEEAIEAAGRIRAKRTLLTHIAHSVSHGGDSAKLPQGMEFAHDGQVVEGTK